MSNFVEHTVKIPHPVLPFVKKTVRSSMFYLDQERYGRWFGNTVEVQGHELDESDFKRKEHLQALYRRELEHNGMIFREIFLQTEADERSKARDYLVWLSVAWQIYTEYSSDPYSEKMTFVQFVQSDLHRDAEYVE